MVTFKKNLQEGRPHGFWGKSTGSRRQKALMPGEVGQAGAGVAAAAGAREGTGGPGNAAQRGILRTLAFTLRFKVMIKGS